MRIARLAPWCLALAGSLPACHSSTPAASVDKAVTVRGLVADETGSAIAGVAVVVGTGAAAAVTGSDGTFAATATGHVGASVPVSLTHPLHANVTSTLYLASPSLSQNFVMRAYDAQQTITLPTDGEAAALVTHGDANASVSVSIPAGSLVHADGSAATGSASVALTFWSASRGPTASMPAPLRGLLAGDTSFYDLFTYGMVDLDITQGNDTLQVAPNHFLELNFVLPPELVNVAANANAGDAFAPALWYANHTSGRWERTAVLGDGNVTFVAQSSSIVAHIPHLSGWNIDGIVTPNACLKGTAIDACGNPLKNANLTLWVWGGQATNTGSGTGGELEQFAFTSKDDGTFCVSINGSADNGTDDDSSQTLSSTERSAYVYAWLSARNDPSTAACNPTNQSTFAGLCVGADPTNAHACAGADWWANGGAERANALDLTAGFARCGMNQQQITLCGYCSEAPYSRCLRRPGLSVRDGGAAVGGTCTDLGSLKTNYCGSPNTPLACQDAKHLPQAGDVCTTTADCCVPSLICADLRCVPKDE